MASSIISAATVLQSLTLGSYAYSWVGTSPVGSVYIQVSNNYSISSTGQILNPGNWVTVPLFYSGSIVMSVPLSGNTGEGMIEFSTGAYAIRTVYTAMSGTGTLQVVICGKVT